MTKNYLKKSSHVKTAMQCNAIFEMWCIFMSCVPGAGFHVLHCLFCRKNANNNNNNNINCQKENYVHYINNKIILIIKIKIKKKLK